MAKDKISKLENRVSKCFGSINFKDVDVSQTDTLTSFIENSFMNYSPCKDYFFIWHDDTDTLHCHFLMFLSKQVRLSTIINYISDSLSISPLAVNIDNCRGVSLCLRYMIHCDDSSRIEGKKQFEISDIASNRDSKYIELLIQEDDDDELTIEGLIKCVLRYRTRTDIMIRLGLKNYHKYRSEIKDLIEDYIHLAKIYPQYIEGE